MMDKAKDNVAILQTTALTACVVVLLFCPSPLTQNLKPIVTTHEILSWLNFPEFFTDVLAIKNKESFFPLDEN